MIKTVLLTGATGFIGRQTIPFLIERGYKIHAISTQENIARHPEVIWHKCNLFDPADISILLKSIRPSCLLHFAWITTPGKCLSSPDNLAWVEASLRLVRLFVENGGKRIVVAGSCAEYESMSLCSEDDNSFKPTTLYGQSKRSLYQILERFARDKKIELAWGYIFYLYGPYEHPDRFLPSVIKGILTQTEIPLTEGLQIRDFLHVREAAEGFVELLNSPAQGCFNIASGEGISIRKMVEKVAQKMGGRELFKFGQRVPALFEPPELVANIHKFENTVVWRPSLSLDQGLEEVIEWWKDQLGMPVLF